MKRGMKAAGWGAALLIASLCANTLHARTAPPRADRVLEAQMRRHIATLASDEFGGREPGTDGEIRTLRYLVEQWFGIGLVSGTNDPGKDWFAPVQLLERTPAASVAQFQRGGRRLYVPADSVLVLTSGKRSLVREAPVLFVGKGDGPIPRRSDLAGRVALLLDGGRDTSDRQSALLAGGASAVLTVLDGERTLEGVAARRRRAGYALASDTLGGDLEGFISRYAMDRLLQGIGSSVDHLQAQASRSGFAPQMLDLNASLEATSTETNIRTHNLIGKLPGRKPGSGAVLFLAHWDHFGTCAEKPAEDLVCNGAIDNASGLAALTETARRLAKAPRADRDINIDSIAISPAGADLAIVGRGLTRLDRPIEEVARRQKRRVISGDAANAYVRRQDGWALLQHDIPAVMVTSAYADISRIERFFDTVYHRPDDNPDAVIELGGAMEDVAFYVALGRWFADSRKVPAP